MDEADNVSDDSQTKMTMTTKTPLSAIAHAFEELSEFLECQVKDEELRLDTFCDACSLVSVLFSSLGLAFRFAEMECVVKIGDLVEASKRFATLENVLDLDVANGTVKKPGSHSRICVVLDRVLTSSELYLKNFCHLRICSSMCTIPHMGCQGCCFCWNVFSSNKGTTFSEAQ